MTGASLHHLEPTSQIERAHPWASQVSLTHGCVSGQDLWRDLQLCCWTRKEAFQPKAQLFLSTHRLEAPAKLWLKTQAPHGNCQLSQSRIDKAADSCHPRTSQDLVQVQSPLQWIWVGNASPVLAGAGAAGPWTTLCHGCDRHAFIPSGLEFWNFQPFLPLFKPQVCQ